MLWAIGEELTKYGGGGGGGGGGVGGVGGGGGGGEVRGGKGGFLWSMRSIETFIFLLRFLN